MAAAYALPLPALAGEGAQTPCSRLDRPLPRAMTAAGNRSRTTMRSIRRRPQLLHLGIGREHGGAIHILEVGHGPGALFERDGADEGAHGGLMIARPVDERAERAVH